MIACDGLQVTCPVCKVAINMRDSSGTFSFVDHRCPGVWIITDKGKAVEAVESRYYERARPKRPHREGKYGPRWGCKQ